MEALAEEAFEKSLLEIGVTMIDDQDISKEKPAIGEGGFGKVYRGKYLDNIVAIKKIKLDSESGEKKDVYNEILNEIRVIQKAIHPNIPTFFGLWKSNQYYNLVFQFIDGKSWKHCYQDMDKKSKLHILKELCSTLEEFHRKKLIHRDIKPDNVMIENGIEPKLIDFGVSKIASKTCTFTKVQIGTLPYMAPEMFDFDEDLFAANDKDAKPVPVSTYSDIWSFGCMMSEIFSGLKPWHKKKDQSLTEQYITGNLVKKTKFPIPNIVDDDVKELIEKCTNYEPLARPSAGEMKVLIEKLMSTEK